MGFVEREGRASTRSIRIDKAFNDELEKEADRQGNSVSNLTNRIIERYLNHQRWSERINSLTIPPIIFENMLELIDENSLAELGDLFGSTIPKEDFIMKGMNVDEESAKLLIMRMLGDYDNWFKVHYHDEDRPYYFIINRLGDKWITFVQAYIRAIYRENLGTDVECIRVGDDLQVLI